jgi:hypothetical protein
VLPTSKLLEEKHSEDIYFSILNTHSPLAVSVF